MSAETPGASDGDRMAPPPTPGSNHGVDADDRLKELELWITVYERVLDTHQDFNDLIMRTRTAGLALVQAVFGVAAFAITRDAFVEVAQQPVHVSAFVILFGLGMIFTLYRIDHTYYFLMLVESVDFGMHLERHAPEFPTAFSPFGLTTAITTGAEKSGRPWRGIKELLNRPESEDARPGERRSRFNVRVFYGVPFLIGVAFFAVVVTSVHPEPPKCRRGDRGTAAEGDERCRDRKALREAPEKKRRPPAPGRKGAG